MRFCRRCPQQGYNRFLASKRSPDYGGYPCKRRRRPHGWKFTGVPIERASQIRQGIAQSITAQLRLASLKRPPHGGGIAARRPGGPGAKGPGPGGQEPSTVVL